MYVNAVSRDLACWNTGASTPRSPPSQSLQPGPVLDDHPGHPYVLVLSLKHEHGMAATRIKTTRRAPQDSTWPSGNKPGL